MHNSVPIKRQSLSDQIFTSLKDQILSGVYKPGDRLPSHAEMTTAMGVSGTVIRDAINKLTSFGFVEVRHGAGTFVRATNARPVILSIASPLEASDIYFMHLLEFRFNLEMMIISEAAPLVTERHLTGLERLCKSLDKCLATRDYLTAVENDWEFHLALAAIKGNLVMQDCLNAIKEALAPILLDLFQRDEKMFIHSLTDHRTIVEALRRRNPEEAEKAMSHHLLRYYQR
jgi:DNA-binding FadR family transcriptional regulator